MPTFSNTTLFQPVGGCRRGRTGAGRYRASRHRNHSPDAGAGDDGQIGRRGTEPPSAFVGARSDAHRLTDLLGGEHQIVLDLLFRQADFGQLVVTEIRGTMAVQAVFTNSLAPFCSAGLSATEPGHLSRWSAAPLAKAISGAKSIATRIFFMLFFP